MRLYLTSEEVAEHYISVDDLADDEKDLATVYIHTAHDLPLRQYAERGFVEYVRRERKRERRKNLLKVALVVATVLAVVLLAVQYV